MSLVRAEEINYLIHHLHVQRWKNMEAKRELPKVNLKIFINKVSWQTRRTREEGKCSWSFAVQKRHFRWHS